MQKCHLEIIVEVLAAGVNRNIVGWFTRFPRLRKVCSYHRNNDFLAMEINKFVEISEISKQMQNLWIFISQVSHC